MNETILNPGGGETYRAVLQVGIFWNFPIIIEQSEGGVVCSN